MNDFSAIPDACALTPKFRIEWFNFPNRKET